MLVSQRGLKRAHCRHTADCLQKCLLKQFKRLEGYYIKCLSVGLPILHKHSQSVFELSQEQEVPISAATLTATVSEWYLACISKEKKQWISKHNLSQT